MKPAHPPINRPCDDETLISEITIQPDGRIFIFGASVPVLEVVEALNPVSPTLHAVLQQVRNQH